MEALLDPSIVLTQLLAGLSKGMLFFIIAAGLTLVLGVQGILNIAHGSLFMLGGYMAVTAVGVVGVRYGFWIALVAVPLAMAVVGALIERGLLRRVYRVDVITQLLLTYGLSLMFADVVRMIWGRGFHMVPRPAMFAGGVSVGPARVASYNLFLLVVGPLIALGLWYLLYRTRFGKTIRAVSADREMAEALGHNVERYFTGVFALGAALAGLGGVLFAGAASLNPTLDVAMLITVFVVVVIGGLGSFGGALLAGLIVGVVEAFGILLFPRLAVVSFFVVMAVVLIIRPWGLFGSPLGPLTE